MAALSALSRPASVGDSLDISPDEQGADRVGTRGSSAIGDFNTGKLLETVPWASSLIHHRDPCMVYAAQFSKHMPLVAAGGSGQAGARVFDCGAGTRSSASSRLGSRRLHGGLRAGRQATRPWPAATRRSACSASSLGAWEKRRPGTAAPVEAPPAVPAPPVAPSRGRRSDGRSLA